MRFKILVRTYLGTSYSVVIHLPPKFTYNTMVNLNTIRSLHHLNTILGPVENNARNQTGFKSLYTHPIYDDNSSVAPIALNILSSLGTFSPESVTEYPLSPSRLNTVQATVLFLKTHHTLYKNVQ